MKDSDYPHAEDCLYWANGYRWECNCKEYEIPATGIRVPTY